MDEQRIPDPDPAIVTQRPRRGGRWIGVILLLGLIVLAAWLLLRHPAGTGTGGGRRHAGAPPVTVGVASVAPADLRVVMQGLGTVTPLATVTIRAQVPGILQTLGFTEGQIVHRGDFLAQIDARPTQALLLQARGALARDTALLHQAQTDYQRYATLNRQDSISRQQVDDQKYLVSQYQGDIVADQGQIDTQTVDLAYLRITSPVTGRVGIRQVDPGNYVQVSDTNGIVIVTQLQPMSVIFVLPEDDVPAIQKRLATGASLTVEAWDRADTARIEDGRLLTLDNEVDTTTGTVKLRALFDNANEALFPQQFVNARLVLRVLHAVPSIPNAAIQTGSLGTFAYVVGADGKATARVMKLGVVDGDRTQVLSGVANGDRVVVDGADQVKDGAHVVIAGAKQ